MERKIKIMGIYVGLLFFVSILLIMITSFTNTKIDPSYDVESVENQQINFNKDMEQNVNILTENNRLLNEKNIQLKKQLDEKENLLNEIKTELEKINRENLSPENQGVYDNLLNKLQ